MFRSLALTFALAVCIASLAAAQENQNQDKALTVESPVGNLHIGPDADAKKIGLPLYPGARLAKRDTDGDKHDQANLSILTDAFGMNLLVAKYESEDPPEKILNFYREKMKKYGKVLECHGTNENTAVHTGDDQHGSKPLKCEGDNTGPVRELKVGTEDNARIMALEDPGNSKGTTFALVYLHTRGKRGEI